MKFTTFLLSVLVIATIAQAQTRPAEQNPPPPPGPFDKGTWDISLTGGAVFPIAASDARFYNFTLAGGKYLFDNNSLSFELMGTYVEQVYSQEHNTILGGFGILGRTHLFQFDKWTLFIDGGGMVTFADDEVPVFGTHFNFVGKAGFGATYELKDHTFLIGGARYFHLSNGQIHGRDQNPNYNGVEGYVGLMWTF